MNVDLFQDKLLLKWCFIVAAPLMCLVMVSWLLARTLRQTSRVDKAIALELSNSSDHWPENISLQGLPRFLYTYVTIAFLVLRHPNLHPPI